MNSLIPSSILHSLEYQVLSMLLKLQSEGGLYFCICSRIIIAQDMQLSAAPPWCWTLFRESESYMSQKHPTLISPRFSDSTLPPNHGCELQKQRACPHYYLWNQCLTFVPHWPHSRPNFGMNWSAKGGGIGREFSWQFVISM